MDVVTAIGAVLEVGLIVFGFAIQPPDTVTLNGNHVSEVTVWDAASASTLAYAKSLILTNTSGQVDIVLPVPVQDCTVLKAQLANVSCPASEVKVDQPVTGTWATVRKFELDTKGASEVDLSTTPVTGGIGFGLSVTGNQLVRLCMVQDPNAPPLQLAVGSTKVSVPTSNAYVPTCSGLALAFRSPSPNPTSGFFLESLVGTQSVLKGKRAKIVADSLTLTMRSTHGDFGPSRGPVQIDSDRQMAFATIEGDESFVIQDNSVDGVSQAVQANENRLPNAVTHYGWLSGVGGAIVPIVVAINWWLAHRRK